MFSMWNTWPCWWEGSQWFMAGFFEFVETEEFE